MNGINRRALYFSTFPQIFYCFVKDPSPLNNKNAFQRLNNLVCSLIESSYIRCKTHYSGWDSVQIVSILLSSQPLSSSILGGLFQNCNYEKTFPESADSGRVPAKIFTIAVGPFYNGSHRYSY